MIKLELLGDFCHECPSFEAVTDRCIYYTYDREKVETSVRCKCESKCRCIKEHLEIEMKKGESHE